jgi:cytochrome c biogenesis protein CcmG/thiol:disulfide interchange protein DsbE
MDEPTRPCHPGWRSGLGLIFFSLVLLFCSSAAVAGSTEETPATPEFDLSPWAGQVVLLDFWASWCGPCRESFPWMDQMQRRYAEQGLVIVAVNVDENSDDAASFLEGTAYEFQHLQDPQGQLAEKFGLTAMPSSILFGRDGTPAFRHAGFHADQTAEYEQNIKTLLANESTPTITLDSGAGGKGGVRPWERGRLAVAGMELGGDPLEMAFDDHIYFSKEASSGGRGFGGGGCGCN